MSEDELLEAYKIVYRTAFDANNYYTLLMLYSEYINNNLEIVNFAPAFWGISKAALSYACLMQVAKLYDESDKAVSIHTLTSSESYSYLSNLEIEQIVIKDDLCKQLGITLDENDYSRYHDLSIKEIFRILKQRKKELKDQIQLVRTYRNKGYAHNDKSRVTSPDDFKDIPTLEKEAMKALIDYALTTCRVIKYLITGSYGTTQYANIDDIHGVFQLLQFGMYEQKKMVDCWQKGIDYFPPTEYESGD
ncbi:MAG: hypothetical protein IKG82_09805 [Oscillospiraceae bacterium]|nr:hypothetical protein [Oscillospiraceae bacterium]